MDDLEYDIYDDLDVFKGNEKQQKECESCAELREQLNSAKQENAQLAHELKEIEKNFHAMLQTSRQEIQRKDTRIKDIQKEKDDICFRRKKAMKNSETKDATTQSKISCKPFALYELKTVKNDPMEKSTESNNRHDENHKGHTNTNANPFASKSKENHEIKANNHLRNLDKNSTHRHQSARHQDEHSSQEDRSLRSKHNNHRPKENERREQTNAERPKRKRSPSVSKEHKRMRRSRSRSRDRSKKDRERDRNVLERSSPDKVSRSLKPKEPRDKIDGSSDIKEQHKRRTSRSPTKHDLRYKLRNKREKSASHAHRHAIENHVEPSEMPSKVKETPDEAIATEQTPLLAEPEKMVNGNANDDDNDVLPNNDYALEEGEIDDSSNDIDADTKSISCDRYRPSTKSKELSDFTGKFGGNVQNVHEVVKVEEKTLGVPKLVAVNVTPTAEVHIACGTPTVSIEHDFVQQQEEQQHHEQQSPLLNGTANTAAVEQTPSEEKQINGISTETESSDHVDENKVEIPFVNEQPEIIDTAKNEKEQKSSAETHFFRGWAPKIDPIDPKQSEDKIVPEAKLENNLQQDAPIPQINDSNSNISPESHETLEPINDSSNSIHNTSGGKSVNISTSKRDYLIVEDENNEQIIYVSRKKKKKNKKNKSTEVV